MIYRLRSNHDGNNKNGDEDKDADEDEDEDQDADEEADADVDPDIKKDKDIGQDPVGGEGGQTTKLGVRIDFLVFLPILNPKSSKLHSNQFLHLMFTIFLPKQPP